MTATARIAPLGAKPNTTVEDEYRALREGAALVDRSSTGRLLYAGADALDLLHRLSTNDLLPLEVGEGAATVLTSPKGRIVDLLLVSRGPDDLLVLTSPGTTQTVLDHVEFYTFGEDVKASDICDETAALSVVGPRAAEVLAALDSPVEEELALFASSTANVDGVSVRIVRTDFVGLPAFDLVVAVADLDRLRQALLAAGNDAGLVPAGEDALEAVRIEQGVPAYGSELGETYNPHEAGLVGYVSFTKGCYTGQEVVVRLATYDKVQKHLVGVSWDTPAQVAKGAKLVLDGAPVGIVTSSTLAVDGPGGMALAYVKTAHANEGVELTAEADGSAIDVSIYRPPLTP